MIRVALLASGTGTNVMKLLHHARTLNRVSIPLVVVDQKTSPLLHLVPDTFPDVKCVLVEAPKILTLKERREIHEKSILFVLKEHSIDWCFLAGYMRLIGPTFLKAFQGEKNTRIVNIHPSLLPKYPGLNAYEQAFFAGEPEGGVTVHFVDSGVDTGPIIAQGKFPRIKKDQLEDFISRGKNLEWQLYPEVLSRLNEQGEL